MIMKQMPEKQEASIKEKALGYHNMPIWTQYGVISEATKTKSLLVTLMCPYCQNKEPICVIPNVGQISVSIDCSCCNNPIKTEIESYYNKEKCCKIFQNMTTDIEMPVKESEDSAF